MEYLEALKRTWENIQESGIPAELHATALAAGLKHYAAGPESSKGNEGTTMRGPAMATRNAQSTDAGSQLASETGLEREAIDDLLYFDADGMPGLNGGARRLGKNNAERSRSIALLLAGARHLAGDEIEVPLDQIRDACKQLGIYDPNNFASYMSEVPGFTLSGPRSSRVLRGKSDVALRFRQRVSEILGVGAND